MATPELTPGEKAIIDAMNKLGAVKEASPHRVPPGQIAALFNEVDTDKSGSIDASEFRAFIMGRFELTGEVADKVFARYDKDANAKLDLDEFQLLVKTINDSIQMYDEKEDEFMLCQNKKLMFCSCFGCCCCGPTLCTSWWCAAMCLTLIGGEIGLRLDSRVARANAAIEKTLTSQEMNRA